MSEILFLQTIVLLCGTVGFVASLRFLRRYLELKQERRALPRDDDLALRLERIEQAVDATAVEVERLAEANRFVSRLLADRAGTSPPASEVGRPITPH